MRHTYKYWFKVGNLQVHCGITSDLTQEEKSLRHSGKVTLHNGKKQYWIEGHIVKIGNITTREAALKWEKKNRLNREI